MERKFSKSLRAIKKELKSVNAELQFHERKKIGNPETKGIWKDRQNEKIKEYNRIKELIIASRQHLLDQIEKERKRSSGVHDNKRIPGSCTLSTNPKHQLPFAEKYGVTFGTLMKFFTQKGAIPEELAILTVAMNILPRKKRKTRFVPLTIIVDTIIKGNVANSSLLLATNGTIRATLRWGDYKISINKVIDILNWLAIHHPDKLTQEESDMQKKLVNDTLVSFAIAKHLMHRCIKPGCRYNTNPFILALYHNGKRPEHVICPNAKCLSDGARTTWCCLCSVDHHPSYPCNMDKKREEHNKLMLSAYPQDGKVKTTPCPSCKFLLIKDEACDHVRCNMVHNGLACQTEFCFGCGRHFNGPNGIYATQGSNSYLDHLIHTTLEGWVCRSIINK